MGLYPIDCSECGEPFQWFSGTLDQRCSKCLTIADEKLLEKQGFLVNNVKIEDNTLTCDIKLKPTPDFITISLNLKGIPEVIKSKLETTGGEMSKANKCDFCIEPCGSEWCSTKTQKLTSCTDCGAATKPGPGSARCPDCWDSRFGEG